MPEEHRVASTKDLDEGSRVIAEIRGREIAVFNYDGEYYAMANYCPHQSGPLCEGEMTGYATANEDEWEWRYVDDERIVTCPWHGWKFDITNGKIARGSDCRVATYETDVRDGDIYMIW
jgi:nitrite reductase/ring-hydroxylating ferredoxin subunit